MVRFALLLFHTSLLRIILRLLFLFLKFKIISAAPFTRALRPKFTILDRFINFNLLRLPFTLNDTRLHILTRVIQVNVDLRKCGRLHRIVVVMLETNRVVFLVYQMTLTFLKTSKLLPKVIIILLLRKFLPLAPLSGHSNSRSQPTDYYFGLLQR